MNPNYTFASFVVGANNQFAHATAMAVAQNPGQTYNPLLLYGGVGLGKTHLLHAIGQHVAANNEGAKVVCLSCEDFTNEFIDAIQNSKLVQFRHKYRHADVLLIDDIHCLASRERTQEEFFHTFNALFDKHKQIVLSCACLSEGIDEIEARLISRFEWGLSAELQPPDIETRLSILHKKAQLLNIKLDTDVLEFLAKRIESDVRRLEGALLCVAGFTSLSGREVTPKDVEQLLKNIPSP